MTAVKTRLDALRCASAELCALRTEERVERVAVVFDAWNDAESTWRHALSKALPGATGFSSEMVREAAAAGFAPLTAEALERLVASEAARPCTRPSVCASILAGAIPMPTLLAVAAPLVLGRAVALKPSGADPVSPEIVMRSVREVDSLLGRCLDIVPLPDPETAGGDQALRELLCAEIVQVTGSDAAVAAISSRVPRGVPVVAHGHRFSAAVVGAAATRGAALEDVTHALARDIARWDQLGCLSPIGIWVVDPEPWSCDALADRLALALDAAELRWPRGALDPAAKAVFHHAVATDAMRDAAGQSVRALEGSAWCVVREAGPTLRPVPLHRFIRVYPADHIDAVRAALAVDATHLAALAIAGLNDAARATLDTLRPSRICGLGELQTPPLDWRRDHLGVLSSLADSGRR